MTDLTPGALVALLETDGITLPGRGEERQIKCFNPHHNDDVPSMRVNVVKGVYHCYLCDSSGNAWTYLTKIRGFTGPKATEILKNLGWTDETFRYSEYRAERAKREKLGQARLVDKPFDMVGGRNGVPWAKCIAQHEYRRADGYLICVRRRYEKIHKRIPKILTFTPASNGKWWEAEPHETSVPPEDRHMGELPLYRLLEFLEAIKGNDKPIWIVKSEKSVEAVLQQASADDFPPVTCLFDGLEGSPSRHDLSPLAKREVLLIADPSAISRKKMTKLAGFLRSHHDCRVQLCLPEGSGGYTFADAVYGIGDYSGGYPGADEWLKQHGIVRYHSDLGWRPLRLLLSQQLPAAFTKQGTFSLQEALRVCMAPHSRKDLLAKACGKFLRKHGVIWYKRESLILFAHATRELRQVLGGTEYSDLKLSPYLKALPGARKPKSRPRLTGGKQPSYVGFTPSGLRRHWFYIHPV